MTAADVDIVLEVYQANYVDGTYTRIGEISTFQDLEYSLRYNEVQPASFKLNIYDKSSSFIVPFQNWILIKRNGAPILFTNIIEVDASSGGSLNVTCADIFYRLNSIYAEGNFVRVNEDAADIVEDIITEVQSRDFANFGITIGEKQTIGDTNETLFYQSFGEAITNQSDNIQGYFVRFEPTLDADKKVSGLVVNIYKQIGVEVKSLPVLELGYSVNSFDVGMEGNIVNFVYTQGQGTGQEVPVTTSQDVNSQKVFGRLESVVKESSTAVRNSLQSKSDTFVSTNSNIKLQLGFTLNPSTKPYFGDFGLMDFLRCDINIKNTFFNFKGLVQITGLDFSYKNQDSREIIDPIITYFK